MATDRRGVLRLCGTVGIAGSLAGCLRLEEGEIDETDGDPTPGEGDPTRAERQEDTEERTDESDSRDDGGDARNEEFLNRFRVLIENETDIEIHLLRVAENRVRLDYGSEYTAESPNGIDETIEIASAYARTVRAGWRVDFLHAEFRDGNEDSHVLRVRTETALDWAAGEISDDEWHERILDNTRSR